MTSQCNCMNSTFGRDGCIAMRCTQKPTSAVGSGMYCDLRPRLIGFQVLPPSSVRNAPGGRDGDEDALGIARIEQDRVQAHAAGAGLPLGPRAVAAQAGQLVPGLAAVGRAEQGGVLHAGVDGVRIGQRRLEVPDALELPGVLRAVVPLVRRERLAGLGRGVVDELVALALGHAVGRGGRLAGRRARLVPGLAAVVGALDDLPEPAAGLRGVDAVRIDGRALQVVDLPAGEVRAADVPLLALAVGREDERALACADQNPYLAHPRAPSRTFEIVWSARSGRRPAGRLHPLYSRTSGP